MPNIYELTNQYVQLQELIEDGAEGLEEILQSFDDAIETKLENTAKVIKNLEGEVTAYKAEEQRLADKRKSTENTIKRLKEAMQDAMLASGKRKVKTSLFSFNIQKNAPSVSVIDDQLLPKHFFVQVDPRLDKKGILERLKAGGTVPGAEMKQTESIRIR